MPRFCARRLILLPLFSWLPLFCVHFRRARASCATELRVSHDSAEDGDVAQRRFSNVDATSTVEAVSGEKQPPVGRLPPDSRRGESDLRASKHAGDQVVASETRSSMIEALGLSAPSDGLTRSAEADMPIPGAALDPTPFVGYRWLGEMGARPLMLGFRLWEFRWISTATSHIFTLVPNRDRTNFAFQCAHLLWDGRSWIGNVTSEAWSCDEAVMMEALWENFTQRLSDRTKEKVSLQCLLTVDDVRAPQRVVWQIVVRPGGEAVIRVPLRRHSAILVEQDQARNMSYLSQRRHLARSGAWVPVDPIARERHPWLNLAQEGRFEFSFREVRPRRHGRRPAVFTFGARAARFDFAIPCGDLRWDGRSWVGNLTGEARGGEGVKLMLALQKDIDDRLGKDRASKDSLRCVLSSDPVRFPNRLVWQIVRSDGQAVLGIRMMRQVADVGGRAA